MRLYGCRRALPTPRRPGRRAPGSGDVAIEMTRQNGAKVKPATAAASLMQAQADEPVELERHSGCTAAGRALAQSRWNSAPISSAILYGSGSLRLLSSTTVSRCAGQRTITLRKPMVSPECHKVSPVMRQPKP